MNLADAGIQLRHVRPGEHRAACPQCAKQGRDDALGVKVGADGSFVAHCFRCGWVTSASGTHVQAAWAEIVAAPALPQRADTLAPQWADFWRDCAPLRGTLAEQYLQHRRCLIPPGDADLRFAPLVWHPGQKAHLPAMVALLTDAVDRTPRSLHFTFLRADGQGKAEIDRPRLLLRGHRKAGAVVRLFADECVSTGLAVAEGVETALCAAHGFAPVWAAVDAGNLAQFPAVPGVESLTIFADHDRAGLQGAHGCARRWLEAGREVKVMVPKNYGHDWADET